MTQCVIVIKSGVFWGSTTRKIFWEVKKVLDKHYLNVYNTGEENGKEVRRNGKELGQEAGALVPRDQA